MELVKLRASQINGCAFCIDMHFRDAKKRGEDDNRLYLLDAWREVTVYSSRERAALAWTETLTPISDGPGPTKSSSKQAPNSVKLNCLI
jgi:AhpD family alkylhydroperoxidase